MIINYHSVYCETCMTLQYMHSTNIFNNLDSDSLPKSSVHMLEDFFHILLPVPLPPALPRTPISVQCTCPHITVQFSKFHQFRDIIGKSEFHLI